MSFSQDHAYMVTTYAAATKYQQVGFANKVLCEMILASQDVPKEIAKHHFSYFVDRARLCSALSKVGNSILLNVVNAGHTLGELLSELKPLCVHLVNAETYADIVLKIAQSDANVLFLCDRFQGDLKTRFPLYTTLPPEHDRNRDLLNREETMNVKILAQKLLFWIIELPLQESPQ
jgi:hypothetical protein